ncbi:MAG TPA: ATP-binding protein [Planctomycetota bacterium]|nr:ATP-binding protein [Planctomycetota bacterium]
MTTKRQARDWAIDVAAIAGSLVHEIKNPLSTLKINAQLLLEDWRDGTQPRELRTIRRLKIIIAEVERQERILQSFLHFTERHELNLKPASLNDLLEDLVEFMNPQLVRKGIQVRLGLDPALDLFPFDTDLIRQVFLNLILNAQSAMEEKGGDLIIRSRRSERDGQSWAVGEVIDTGHGIPPEVRQKVFNLYYSTRKEGTGLGLATSKRITEEHGGFMEVESEVGKGSQFSVYLPLEAGEGG